MHTLSSFLRPFGRGFSPEKPRIARSGGLGGGLDAKNFQQGLKSSDRQKMAEIQDFWDGPDPDFSPPHSEILSRR
jgi:hypothetical protein